MSSSTTLSHIQPQQPVIGLVRAVNSGDLILVQELNKDTKEEYSLSHLTVPRLGHNATNDKPATKDTPFAWESREFLRKKCIGKRVHLYVDYTTPVGRKYATVFLPDDTENSLNKQMIAEGWATLFKSQSGKENKKPEYLDLIKLETEAAQQELGIHNKNPEAINNSIRPIHNIQPFDLFNKLKGKPLQAVVEQVRNASSYRVVILPSFHSFIVQLSGIQCPGYKRDTTGNLVDEPYAVEAETFITKNVLHREVTLTLDTFDKQGNLFGSVVCVERDVATELLKNGYGSFVSWSSQNKTQAEQTALKNAEQTAKNSKLRFWSDSNAAYNGGNNNNSSTTTTTTTTASTATNYGPTKATDTPQEISGKVFEISNSCQLSIVTDNKLEYKVTLASLKIPVLSKPQDTENTLPKDQQLNLRFERYFAYEAKEWLRKRLVGQRVVAKHDYTRPANPTTNLPEKAFYSVYLGKANVSLGLVENGLAKLFEHKGADNRASDYEALITAENKAKKKSIGLFSNKENAPTHQINDCSSDDKSLKAKATKLLPHIRGVYTPGIVDYVFSAQRFKVYCEKQLCVINLSLQGVRAPKRDEDEDLSNQALQYAREQLHQHEVTVFIQDVDKGGNFIGSLSVGNKNFAFDLIEMGYASIYDPLGKNPSNFAAAEEKAKKARIGVWKNYDPEEEKRQYEAQLLANEEKKQAFKSEFGEATIRYISSPSELYVEFVNQKNEDISRQLESLGSDTSTDVQGSKSLKEGDLCKIKSVSDNKFYRARVISIQANGNYLVRLIDLGDVESIPSTKIVPLPAKFKDLPALVTAVQLHYIKPSKDEFINNDAIDFLNEEFNGVTFAVTIESRDENNKPSVVLQDKQGSVNSELLKNGLVKLDSRARGSLSSALQADENTAKSKYLGVWRHGDVGSDEEDENQKPKFQKGKGKNFKK